MKHALDLSNYTQTVTAEQVANWRDNADIGACFVQAVDPPDPYPPTKTRAQCQAILDAGGVALHAYVFWWFGAGTDFLQRQLDLLSPFAGQLAGIWPDVEDTSGGLPQLLRPQAMEVAPPAEARLRIQRQWHPSGLARVALGVSPNARVDDLASWLEITDQLPTLSGKSGIYAAGWHWVPYMGNSTHFSDAGYRLWVASFNGQQTLDAWSPFGGWQPPAAVHQYAGTSAVLGTGGLDLDVVSDPEVIFPSSPSPSQGPSVGDLQQALAYLADTTQKNADEVARVARQYGAIP